jgi:uncharacterized protein (DUF697 family)
MFESIPPKHRRTIAIATKSAVALGVPGALWPVADTMGITGIWTTMTWKIAEESGHPMDKAAAAKFASAALSGVMSYVVGSKIFTWLLHLIPGFGTLGSMTINSTLNGLFTYRLGRYLIGQFRRPNFTTDNMMDSSIKLVSVIIVLPTGHEIKEVIGLIRGFDLAA